MLDIFGSVFGRSKKSSNTSSGSAAAGRSADDDFVCVERPPTNIYPSIMLTNQMLKGDTSSGTTSGQATNIAATTGTSTVSSNLNVSGSATWNSHVEQPFALKRTTQTSISPLDNVPFQFAPSTTTATLGGNFESEFAECLRTINSIASYLQAQSSEYNFKMERNIINQFLSNDSKSSHNLVDLG